jgi:hypothetical protein
MLRYSPYVRHHLGATAPSPPALFRILGERATVAHGGDCDHEGASRAYALSECSERRVPVTTEAAQVLGNRSECNRLVSTIIV